MPCGRQLRQRVFFLDVDQGPGACHAMRLYRSTCLSASKRKSHTGPWKCRVNAYSTPHRLKNLQHLCSTCQWLAQERHRCEAPLQGDIIPARILHQCSKLEACATRGSTLEGNGPTLTTVAKSCVVYFLSHNVFPFPDLLHTIYIPLK